MRTNGWVLIARRGCDYYFCDSVFKHRDDFQGATGSVVRPVSPEEYEWACDIENVKERLCDVYCEMNDIKDYDLDDDDPDFTKWVQDVIAYDGAESVMFDESDCCDASDSFTELGIEHECTDCSGGGRIFGNWNSDGRMEFDEVFNVKALVAIEAFEAGAVSLDYVSRAVFGEE